MAKGIIDPNEPTPQPDAQILMAQSMMEMAKAIRDAQPTEDTRRRDAEVLAEAHRRALKPENADFPDVSVYNPHGERDHRRTMPPWEIFWCGSPVALDVNTIEEIALAKQIHTAQGRWKIRKSDNSDAIVVVRVEKDTDDNVTKVIVQPEGTLRGSAKHNWPLMTIVFESILRQASEKKAAA